MKKFFLFCIFLILLSCSSVKEGFQNNKKNNSDEFLVEKKTPLVMPPDFEKMPKPNDENEKNDIVQNSLKELIKKNDTPEKNSAASKNFEKLLLDKIKKN